MCHNDIHRGNVMRNKEGELNPEEVVLVDFDAAQYGYREVYELSIFAVGHTPYESYGMTWKDMFSALRMAHTVWVRKDLQIFNSTLSISHSPHLLVSGPIQHAENMKSLLSLISYDSYYKIEKHDKNVGYFIFLSKFCHQRREV